MKQGWLVVLPVLAAFSFPAPADATAVHGTPPLLAVAGLGQRPGITVMTTSGRLVRGRSIRVPSSTFAISPDGQQIAYDSGAFAVSVRPTYGRERTAVIPRADDPAWSPDGQELAVDGYGAGAPHGTSNIFTVRPSHAKRLFIRDQAWDSEPAWSPDGRLIAFERDRSDGVHAKGRSGIFISDGTSMRLLVAAGAGYPEDPAWSPDGTQIAFDDEVNGDRTDVGRTRDVFVINADGTDLRQVTHDPRRDDISPEWSPDGKALAFTVSRVRSAVGVRTIGSRAPTCLLRPGWSFDWPVAWIGGDLPTPDPSHCAPSLRPARPKAEFGCTKAAARSAVDRSALPLAIKQYAHHPGYGDITKRCVDFTHDGRQDIAVLFDGGGSGGVIAWAAFRRTPHDWKLVLFKKGDRLTVAVVGSDLLESYPVYRPHDSHADPTGGVAHVQFRWVRGRLVVVARWRTAD